MVVTMTLLLLLLSGVKVEDSGRYSHELAASRVWSPCPDPDPGPDPHESWSQQSKSSSMNTPICAGATLYRMLCKSPISLVQDIVLLLLLTPFPYPPSLWTWFFHSNVSVHSLEILTWNLNLLCLGVVAARSAHSNKSNEYDMSHGEPGPDMIRSAHAAQTFSFCLLNFIKVIWYNRVYETSSLRPITIGTNIAIATDSARNPGRASVADCYANGSGKVLRFGRLIFWRNFRYGGSKCMVYMLTGVSWKT